jgi:putative ABC transport system permease protein
VQTDNLPQTITFVKEKFSEFFPGNFFDYEFLDDRFNQQYKDDQLFGKVFGLFAGFAIFIACLGLFALSAFIASLQTKAIGIRKVLGATVSSIVTMLSRDFLLLVLVSVLIASPVAWWVMDKWLQDFAYHISISWWVFLLAGGIALFIAMITVSFQSIKAALANPVKALRSE